MKKQIKDFEKKIKINFKNEDVLENAFVHRSYLNENPGFHLENNERLEFLGDAVLELAATRYLFDEYNKPEGELTALRSALVRGRNLAEISDNMGVFECLYLSTGERNGSEKARSLILANCLEAIIGAIYLDLGYPTADNFIKKQIIEPRISAVIDQKLYIDAKSHFQERIQEVQKITPVYRVLSEEGPDHNKKFVSGVYIEEKLVAKGEGSSKNASEQDAAINAALKLKL